MNDPTRWSQAEREEFALQVRSCSFAYLQQYVFAYIWVLVKKKTTKNIHIIS